MYNPYLPQPQRDASRPGPKAGTAHSRLTRLWALLQARLPESGDLLLLLVLLTLLTEEEQQDPELLLTLGLTLLP